MGEYVHQLAIHLAQLDPECRLTLFTSSSKDRPVHSLQGPSRQLTVSDHRIPVSLLNLAWHNLGWPPVEAIAPGEYDVVLSPHPLLVPSRRAAQVITIHDLDFLDHPQEYPREIRRDYPRLTARHAAHADRILVSSQSTADEVVRRLGVRPAKLCVCPPGVPNWTRQVPARPIDDDGPPPRDVPDGAGHVLFIGTLGPRKNLPTLLGAYRRLLDSGARIPNLKLVGRVDPATAQAPWFTSLRRPPLAGRVEVTGYLPEEAKPALYADARVLVLPSRHEGFGLPVLEAMATGVPVVCSDRGALPEVAGNAALLVDPGDETALAGALERVLSDSRLTASLIARGRARAARLDWRASATLLHRMLQDLVEARVHRH